MTYIEDIKHKIITKALDIEGLIVSTQGRIDSDKIKEARCHFLKGDLHRIYLINQGGYLTHSWENGEWVKS